MSRLCAIVVACAACGAPEASAPAAAGRPSPGAEAAPDPAPMAPTGPDPAPMTPEVAARVKALASRFARGRCEASAVDELRSLVRTHGDTDPMIETQQLAFKVCEDPVALAELLARTLPQDATQTQRLQLGAALLRASRYHQAAEVLVPLAEAQGPTSQAAWLAGFALFHAGASDRARPLLESARDKAPAGRADAWLLIGLCKLHEGDIEGATAELEAGVAKVEDDPSLWSALSRAYAAADREDDARRARERAREVHESLAEIERSKTRLAARGRALQSAAKAQDVEAVERLFEQMWPDAPAKLQVQMLQLRAQVYAEASRSADAKSDRAQAETLARTLSTDRPDTP